MKNNFTFYHYTKSFPEKIKFEGLKKLSWNEYRFQIYNNIPDNYKKEFSFLIEELLLLDELNHCIREGSIYLTTQSFDNSLLRFYYGGEYLRRVIQTRFNEIEKHYLFEILSKIGVSMRIKIEIADSELLDWQIDQLNKNQEIDIYIKRDVKPDQIKEIKILK